MCSPSIVLWCYVLLLVASSSDSLENSTNNNQQKENLTVQYDLFANSMTDPIDGMQYEFHINSNDRKDLVRYDQIMKIHEENNQMFMELRMNSTEINDENNSTLQAFNENFSKTDRDNNSISYELYRNVNADDYNNTMVTIISNEVCDNETCIQLCCPFGERLTSDMKCVAGQDNYSFPNVNQNNSANKKLNELFQLTVRDPCVLQGHAHRSLDPDEYLFLINGSLYQNPGGLISSTSYCLGVLDRNIYDVIACMDPLGLDLYLAVCLLVSLPFLLLTFVVYSILPEVQNIHSCTLRVHVASLFITNVIIFCIFAIPELSEWKYCIPLAYVFNFATLSGRFWLNATCFDIWWTFRKLDLRQTNQKKKKQKFLVYSIYAWGVTFGLTVICAIMDLPDIPKNLIQPQMCKTKFWLSRDDSLTVYYFGPTGASFISNICFFAATAVAILYHEKHTAQQLRDSESRRYNKNKRKFGMYMKLFVVMGVSWNMGLILWWISISDPVPIIYWYISFTIDYLQGLVIFVMYVCKRKILRLLLKRFGLKKRGPFGNTAANSHCTRTSSNMSKLSTISESVSMRSTNRSINKQTNHHVESNAI